MKDNLTISFKNKLIKLHFEEFDDEVDMDEWTTIDYSNLYAEMITIPALMNRVGILKAQAERSAAHTKLSCKIAEAEKWGHYKKELKTVGAYANGAPKMQWATKDEIDAAVTLDEEIINQRKRVIRYDKEAGYLDALYWAVKAKEKKLDKIVEGMRISPEDFEKELVEGKVNGIFIKIKKQAIQ